MIRNLEGYKFVVIEHCKRIDSLLCKFIYY